MIKFVVIFVFVIFDQILKSQLGISDSVVLNTGIAFGINLPPPLLNFLLYLALGWLAWLIGCEAKRKNKISKLMIYALILGGGVSNVIDRLVRGAVVDYISVGRFPSFNIADVMIVGGVVWYLFTYFCVRRSAAVTTFSSK